MAHTHDFDGPRRVRVDELRASQYLSSICFNDLPNVPDEETQETSRLHEEGETYLIACDGKPVSQISTFLEQLNFSGSRIRIGSIGGVCTHPDYRGHGYASILMEHCTRRLVQRGANLMLISGGRGLYRRLGNVPTGTCAAFHLKPGQLHPPKREITLRPAAKADAALCSAIYQAEPVRFARRLPQFEQSIGRPAGYFHAEELIIEMDGRPRAYLLLNTPWEYGSRPELKMREVFEYAGSRVALAGGIAAALEQYQFGQLDAYLPWQDFDLAHLLIESGARTEPDALPGHTMRIINFPALMSDLRPYLQARLSPALRRGLYFEQSGPLLGAEGGDIFSIIRGCDRLDLDGETMTYLVMGDPTGEHIADLAFPGALREVINALFPLPAFLPGLCYH